MPIIENNVGTTERVISTLAGAYVLYDALVKEKKSILKGFLVSFLLFRGATGICPVYKAIEKGKEGFRTQNINIKTKLSVRKPRNEVYEFWRRLENLPLFMKHLKSVKTINEKTSEWEANTPGGVGSLQWKSEIVKDIPNEHIGWQSLPDATIVNAGNVKFIDAGKFGTEVHVVISYHAPGGIAGEGIGRSLNPVFENMVREDIKNLKRYMETGEIPTIEGQPSAK